MPQSQTQQIHPHFTRRASQHGFSLAAFMAETDQLFPEFRNHIFFLDLTTMRFAGAHDRIVQKLRAETGGGQVSALWAGARHYAEEKGAAVKSMSPLHHVIMLPAPEETAKWFQPSGDAGRWMQFVCDHELAHVVMPQGGHQVLSKTIHESTADLYAMLRHMQRFGPDTDALEWLMLTRAQRLICLQGDRHAVHFTSPVLEKLADLRGHKDVENLDLRETMALAENLALLHTPNDCLTWRIRDEFAPVQKALANPDTSDTAAAFRQLAHILLETSLAPAFHWGHLVMRGYLDGKLGAMKNGTLTVNNPPPSLHGPYWDDMREKLAWRAALWQRDARAAAPAATPTLRPANDHDL